MFILKKVTKMIHSITQKMEPVSRRLLFSGAYAVVCSYAAACVCLVWWQVLFPDLDTAYYWSAQCACLAKELLGAFFVPVLLFEIVLTGSGAKAREK